MGAPHHDEETIELALTALALAGDSPTKAVARLKDDGVRVSRCAIRKWREQHADRYAAIRETRARDIERSVINRHRALAERYCVLEDKLIDAIDAEIDAGNLKDASTTARNVAVSKGIALDKMLIMDGRPNAIIDTRSADDVLRALEARGFLQYVDADAEEIAPGELPSAA